MDLSRKGGEAWMHPVSHGASIVIRAMRILIAEDDAVSRRLLSTILARAGHEVIAAENGLQAWDALQDDAAIELAILDWMMPELDGVEVCRRLRERESLAYVYVILLTARGDRSDMLAGFEAGADDYVTKPFDRAELESRIAVGQRVVHLERRLSEQVRQLDKANSRMRADLESAAQVQATLLPSASPAMNGFEADWLYVPCDELAGDCFSVFRLDETHVGLYVLDVSGHGVSAALFSVVLSRQLSPAMAQSSVLKYPVDEAPGYRIRRPAEVARFLNEQFPSDERTGQYFTMIYGVLDESTREFRFVRAGHPALLRVKPDGSWAMEGKGCTAIGWFPGMEFEDHVIRLEPGERLLLYSDGVSEAHDEEMEQFGVDRMAEAFASRSSGSLAEALNAVLDGAREWAGERQINDDVTLLALGVTGTGG